jgi:hypothetical protein
LGREIILLALLGLSSNACKVVFYIKFCFVMSVTEVKKHFVNVPMTVKKLSIKAGIKKQ